MPKAIILFFGFVTLFGGLGVGQPHSQWTEYVNPVLGVRLRYPSDTLEPVVTVWPRVNQRWPNGSLDLVTREIDPERPELERVIALRIVISHLGRNLPMSFYRSQKGYRKMKVGGRFAANSISCGRGACHWTIHVSGSAEVSILTLDRDESQKSGPDDARYPLRGIIDSIAFDQAFPK